MMYGDKGEAFRKATDLLEILGLEHRKNHYPYELSGGEQQRVAVGRALVNSPLLFLGDEITGNLDPETGEQVWQVLKKINKTLNQAVVIATHNMELAKTADTQYRLCHGVLILV